MGLWHRLNEVTTAYAEALDPWKHFVVPVLQEIPARSLVEQTSLSRRTIQRLRNEHMRPHQRNAAALTAAAGSFARTQLKAYGIQAPRSDILACRAWIASRTG